MTENLDILNTAVSLVFRAVLLTVVRDELVKIGCKVVCPARYVTLRLAEVTVPYRLCRAILDRIRRIVTIPLRAAPI